MITQRDFFLGMFTVTAWAGNAIAIKFITFEVEPFTAFALRMIAASILFLPFIRWPGREQFILLAQITILLSILHWSSLTWSIAQLEASMASILMQTQAIFSVLLGCFFFKERFGWRTAAGIAIGTIGVIILVGLPQNPPDLYGVLGLTLSMLLVALSYTRMKYLHGITPANYMAHLYILGLLPAIALAFIFEKPLEIDLQAINIKPLGLGLLYQVATLSAAHMIWQRLMARNAMSGLPNLTLLLPLLGVIFAVLFLKETVTPSIIAGGLVTTLGVGIVMIRKRKSLVS